MSNKSRRVNVVRQRMVGRRLCSETEAILQGFAGAEAARRRAVLHETINAFEKAQPVGHYHRLAEANLQRWWTESDVQGSKLRVEVLRGDWGVVTQSLTRTQGVCFAVLNMANAYVPGGAYIEGAIAQEENMFRRTDCHFRISEDEYDSRNDCYLPEITKLLTACSGAVYLDLDRPRVCIRGPEDLAREDLGYPWLADDQVFAFFELRAAAQDLRDGSKFDPAEARRRVAAQLDTLRNHGIRHAVLGAFGCGAFRNPAREVAQIYREEIFAREADLSVIAFAIFAAGYGPDNFMPFAEVFANR